MSTIQVSNLHPAGSELFQDSESFLYELSDVDTMLVGGRRGNLKSIANVVVIVSSATVFTANTNTINANTITNANTLVG